MEKRAARRASSTTVHAVVEGSAVRPTPAISTVQALAKPVILTPSEGVFAAQDDGDVLHGLDLPWTNLSVPTSERPWGGVAVPAPSLCMSPGTPGSAGKPSAAGIGWQDATASNPSFFLPHAEMSLRFRTSYARWSNMSRCCEQRVHEEQQKAGNYSFLQEFSHYTVEAAGRPLSAANPPLPHRLSAVFCTGKSQ